MPEQNTITIQTILSITAPIVRGHSCNNTFTRWQHTPSCHNWLWPLLHTPNTHVRVLAAQDEGHYFICLFSLSTGRYLKVPVQSQQAITTGYDNRPSQRAITTVHHNGPSQRSITTGHHIGPSQRAITTGHHNRPSHQTIPS